MHFDLWVVGNLSYRCSLFSSLCFWVHFTFFVTKDFIIYHFGGSHSHELMKHLKLFFLSLNFGHFVPIFFSIILTLTRNWALLSKFFFTVYYPIQLNCIRKKTLRNLKVFLFNGSRNSVCVLFSCSLSSFSFFFA